MSSSSSSLPSRLIARRTLVAAGLAHALHDGLTDMVYVLLPVWQAEFAIGYGALALLRGLYAGAMALFQVPASRLTGRLGVRALLVGGTVVTALGYVLAGISGSILGLVASLTLAGVGASTQHPLASAAVARAYGGASRGPLGLYNFAGDLGKAALPAALSFLLTAWSWRPSLLAMAGLTIAAALVLAVLFPVTPPPEKVSKSAPTGQGRGGFGLLLGIGILDSGVRMGLLTFLPFLLQEKGAPLPTVGVALGLVFMGGAAGKFICGWLSQRLGVLGTVLLTEGGTALIILAVMLLPLTTTMILLPLLGALLNGTSSALYGTVPDLTPPHQIERAFALFYLGNIGSGALSPVLYGLLGDWAGIHWGTIATALAAVATCPLALLLARHLAPTSRQTA